MFGMNVLAKHPKTKGYADGGVVNTLRGMVGLKPEDPERARRLAEYKANAEREKEAAKAAAAAPAPAPAPAISDYAAGGALKRREAAAGLKDGGPVRGPGTGTSDDVPDTVREGTYIMPADSTRAIGEDVLARMGARGMGPLAARSTGAAKVPVNLSNGEFKLTPKQVHAIGVQVLNQAKDATHTPSSTKAAKGMKPELFFANGGLVEDEKKRPNSFGDAAAAASTPGVTQVASPAPAAATPPPPPPASPADAPAPASGAVTRVGNSYSGGNVSGDVAINGQSAGGGYMGAGGQVASSAGAASGARPADGSPTPTTWSDTISKVEAMGFKQNPVQPPAAAHSPVQSMRGMGALMGASREPDSTATPGAALGAEPGAPAAAAKPSTGGNMPEPQPGAAQAMQTAQGMPGGWNRHGLTNSEVGQANPQGVVTAQRGANGTMEFSGGNVSGPVSYADPSGKALPGGGLGARGFSDPAEFVDGRGGRDGGSGGRSPVGMTVEQAQREGLIGEAIGYNPAYDQRLTGARGMVGIGWPGAATSAAPVGAQPGAPAASSRPGAQAPAFGGELPEPQAESAASQARPGVYQHGRGQYSDNARGMSMSALLAGQPSRQNAQAADALAGRQQQESMGRVTARGMGALVSGEVQAPQVLHSGNSWQARNDLRNAEVSASSITNSHKWGGMGKSSPAMQNYAAALKADNDARAAQPGMDAAAMRENAATQRADMQQQGENTRSSMQVALADIRERRAAGQQATQNDLARQRLVLDAARVGREGVPSGYRPRADGALEAIPGGPADPATQAGKKPLNDTQSKALQFGTRMQQSGQNLDALASDGATQPGYIKRMADAVGAGALANWTQSPQQQQVEQSQRDFVNAVLRRESGAAISNGEFDNARMQYFPQPGDSAKVIEQKRRNRELATRGVLAEVPDQQSRVQQVTGGGQRAPGYPQQRTATRTGTLNGRRVVQYSDGSISYAD